MGCKFSIFTSNALTPANEKAMRNTTRTLGNKDVQTSWSKRSLRPPTINVRLAAVRRLAYEASGTGLLSPELAAGIHRVKGAKRLGVRIGNWLTIEQARALLQQAPADALRATRDRAILAVLIGRRLRRAERVALRAEDLQIREEHWVIADLIGKGKHIRTAPVPKRAVDAWTVAAGINAGSIFRRVSRMGKPGALRSRQRRSGML